MYLNRTLCDVLYEMRECYKTRNFCNLNGLIEEAQSMGNKMEAGLGDKRDLLKLQNEKSKFKQQVNNLKQQVEALGVKKKKLQSEISKNIKNNYTPNTDNKGNQ